MKGRINNVSITTSLQSSGNGWFAMVVNRELLERLGRAAGDSVKVEIALDKGPAVIAIPPALRAALRATPRAKATFERLARRFCILFTIHLLLHGTALSWVG